MSVESGDAAPSPDWEALSEELQALLTQEGPLKYGALRTRYMAMYGRALDFRGHKLRDSLTNGNLKGLRFDTTNHALKIGIEPAKMDAPKFLPRTGSSNPPDPALLPDELLAHELRALVSREGPLPTLAVANQYQATYGNQLTLHGYQLRARLKDGNLPGLLYNEGKGTMELTRALKPRAAAPGTPDGNLKGPRFNTTTHTLEVGIEPANMDAPKVLPPAPPSSPPDPALLPDELLAQELLALASSEGALPMKAVANPPSPPSSPPDPALAGQLLAQELRALVSSEGPLPTLAVANRYQATYGKQLTLHGYGLRARLKDGNLPGLLYSKEKGTVELADAPTPHPAAPTSPERIHPGDKLIRLVTTEGSLLLKNGTSTEKVQPTVELTRLVRKEGPLLLEDVAPLYFSVFRKKFERFGGRKLINNLRDGKLKGLRYNEVSRKMELDVTLCPNAKELEASPAQQPTVHAEVPAGAADVITPPADIITADPAPAKATERLATMQAALQGACAPAAISKKRPQGAVQRPVSAPSRPVPTSRRVSGVGAASRPPPPSRSSPSSSPSGTKPPYFLVDSPASCKKALATISRIADRADMAHTLQDVCMGSMVVVQLNGRQLGSEAGVISLIKLRIVGPLTLMAIIFDVVTLNRTPAGQTLLHTQLCPLLADERATKVVHDFNNSAIALRRYFGAGFTIHQVLDLQLAFEAVHGRIGADAVAVMRAFGQDASYSDASCRAFGFDEAATARRPLDTSTLGGAAMAVISMAKVADSAVSRLSEQQQEGIVLHASQMATEFAVSSTLPDTRRTTFRNHGSCWGGGIGRVLTTFELKKAREISTIDMAGPSASAGLLEFSQPEAAAPNDGGNLTSLIGNMKSFLGNMKLGEAAAAVEEDPNSPSEILKLAPEEFLQDHLTARHTQNLADLIELVIDEGRRPYATLQERGKLYLCNDEAVVVTKAHIDRAVGRLNSEGRFGHDNRAGVPGQLHRVSVMRSREGGRIYGVTLRIGRYFPGSANVIDDLLFHVQDGPDKPERAASILVLGKPGSGKTTVLRDICRKVSEEQTVVIVDTSNEIAGDGDIPHLQAIGQSRRMMVPNKDGQHSVMKEALQNHTPQTIVVDEVSNKLEARACLDIKTRGVRMVASAHGDLQSLLKNPELNSLVGGSISVTLGDMLAKASNGGNKVQSQRAGAPIFDVVVEVERGEVCTWSIVKNVDLAVDAILDGKPYRVEKRTCIPQEGSDLQQQASDPDDVAFLLQCVNEVEKTRQYY